MVFLQLSELMNWVRGDEEYRVRSTAGVETLKVFIDK